MNIKQNIKSIILALILTLGIGFAVAATDNTFTPPSCPPPNCNVPAPINVGTNAQIKFGPLTVKGFAVVGDFKYFPLNGIPPKSGQILMADDTDLGNGRIKWGDLKDIPDIKNTICGIIGSCGNTTNNPGGNNTQVVYHSFFTKYNTIIADSTFRAWLNDNNFDQNGDDDHGWYNRKVNRDKFLTTASKLCSFFMEGGYYPDGGMYNQYNLFRNGDYGSNNNNIAYYWNPGLNKWVSESNDDNGSIDIVTLSCAGNSILNRGVRYAM